MAAFGVVCVTVTLGVLTPVTVAVPPTTVGPSGLAIATASPSGISAVEANRAVRIGCQADMSVPRRRNEEEAPVIAGTCDRLGCLEIDIQITQPPQPDTRTGRSTCYSGRGPHRGGQIIALALVDVSVELCAGDRCRHPRNDVAKLETRHPAMIAEDFGGVVSPPEHPAAITALLGREQRVHGVLGVAGNQGGKTSRQGLEPAHIGLNLAEIDPADRAGGE